MVMKDKQLIQILRSLNHPSVVAHCYRIFIILGNIRLPSLHKGVVHEQLMVPLENLVIPIIDYLNILTAFTRLKCQMI